MAKKPETTAKPARAGSGWTHDSDQSESVYLLYDDLVRSRDRLADLPALTPKDMERVALAMHEVIFHLMMPPLSKKADLPVSSEVRSELVGAARNRSLDRFVTLVALVAQKIALAEWNTTNRLDSIAILTDALDVLTFDYRAPKKETVALLRAIREDLADRVKYVTGLRSSSYRFIERPELYAHRKDKRERPDRFFERVYRAHVRRGFAYRFKNALLRNTAEVIRSGRRPTRGHVKIDVSRQLVGMPDAFFALDWPLNGIDGEGGAMCQQRQAGLHRLVGEIVPERGGIVGEGLRPGFVARGHALRGRGVLDRRQKRRKAGRTAAHLQAGEFGRSAKARGKRQRVGDRGQRGIGVAAERLAQGHSLVRRQFGNELFGERSLAADGLRPRGFLRPAVVLGADEAAFDTGFAVVCKRNDRARARDIGTIKDRVALECRHGFFNARDLGRGLVAAIVFERLVLGLKGVKLLLIGFRQFFWRRISACVPPSCDCRG